MSFDHRYQGVEPDVGKSGGCFFIKDADGFALGHKLCPPPQHPWVLKESKKYAGRYFFHNKDNDVSSWRLPPWGRDAETLPPSPPPQPAPARMRGKSGGNGMTDDGPMSDCGNGPHAHVFPPTTTPAPLDWAHRSWNGGSGSGAGSGDKKHGSGGGSGSFGHGGDEGRGSFDKYGGGDQKSSASSHLSHFAQLQPFGSHGRPVASRSFAASSGPQSTASSLSFGNTSSSDPGSFVSSFGSQVSQASASGSGGVSFGPWEGRQGYAIDLPEALALGQARGLADQRRTGRPFAGSSVATCGVPLEVTGGLGLGGYGVVVKARLLGQPAGGQHYALKVIAKAGSLRPKDHHRLMQELRVLTEVPPNPFLQRCHLAFETTADLFMVLDFVGGGDLFFHLEELTRAGFEGFPEPAAAVLLAELSLGLVHLHAGGFVHRDVKVENIMLDAQGHVKLVDFGLALPIEPMATPYGDLAQPMSPTGSLIYMSPELLDSKIGGRFTDWWALGVVAHELLTGRSPWSTLSDKRQIRREIRGESVLRLPRHLSNDAQAFVGCLLKRDYRQRLGTHSDAEVLAAPFFTCIDWRAAAAGRLEPAFVPRADAQSSGDRDEALRGYSAKLTGARPPRSFDASLLATPWTLGLPQVAAAPPVVVSGGCDSSTKHMTAQATHPHSANMAKPFASDSIGHTRNPLSEV